MSLFLDPKFWLSISFLLFLLLTIKFIWPFIISKIDIKLKEVLDSVKLAEKSLKESDKLLSDAEKLYKNAVISSKNLLSDADKEAQALIARSQKTVEEEMEKKLIAIQNRVKKEEEKLIRELKSKIIESAIDTIEKDSLQFKPDIEEDLVIDSIDNISVKVH